MQESFMDIPVEASLTNALRFKLEETKLRDEFTEWLPEEIIDCHARRNRKEDVTYVGEKTRTHMLSTFPY